MKTVAVSEEDIKVAALREKEMMDDLGNKALRRSRFVLGFSVFALLVSVLSVVGAALCWFLITLPLLWWGGFFS